MGTEIARQMTSEPKSWVIASVGMLAFAAVPGMPTGVFIFIALITGGLGYYLIRQRQRQAQPAAEAGEAVRPEENGSEDLRGFDPSRPYLLQFSPVLRGTPEVTDLIHGIRQARNALVANIGLTLPPFEVELDDSLADDEMRFCVHEVPMVKASVVNYLAVERKALKDEPAHGIPGLADRDEQGWIWLAPDDPLLDDPQLERFSATNLIVERMKQAMMLSGPQFLGT